MKHQTEIVVINKAKISKKLLNKIIRFVRPNHISIPKIYIRKVNSFSFYGAYYYPNGKPRRIYASVGFHDKFPTFVMRNKIGQKQGYATNFWINSQEEAFCYLIAHELKHHYQSTFKMAFSEKEADEYALKKLKNWRKKKKKV
jgi:hypothetical protein